MEAALGLEDDAFFKDLSKQISLLVMDDDDDDRLSPSHSSPLNLQAFTEAINPSTQGASFFSYDHHQASKRESKGTRSIYPSFDVESETKECEASKIQQQVAEALWSSWRKGAAAS